MQISLDRILRLLNLTLIISREPKDEFVILSHLQAGAED